MFKYVKPSVPYLFILAATFFVLIFLMKVQTVFNSCFVFNIFALVDHSGQLGWDCASLSLDQRVSNTISLFI